MAQMRANEWVQPWRLRNRESWTQPQRHPDDLNLALVRCDIINRGIQDDEGRRVANLLLDSYRNDEEFDAVRDFNKKPDTFDIDDFISRQNQKWKEETCTSV
jgi:hypothetical protein